MLGASLAVTVMWSIYDTYSLVHFLNNVVLASQRS